MKKGAEASALIQSVETNIPGVTITFPVPTSGEGMSFAAEGSGVGLVPSTLNSKDRTVDVCWYGGATVPRTDRKTGEEYMLKLEMKGCRFDRLNAGAPVFDSHMNGTDFMSMLAERLGTEAQIGVVVKAWAEGEKGMATLKFDASENAQKVWDKIEGGIIRNLSFGAWIYTREPQAANAGGTTGVYFATDWEPFEISPVPVPADFTTEFLSANVGSGGSGTARANAHQGESMRTNTQEGTGTEARVDEQQLLAAREEGKLAGQQAEVKRQQDIRAAAQPFVTKGLIADTFVLTLTDDVTLTVEQARVKIMDQLAANSGHEVQTGVSVVRDQRDTVRENMEASLFLRADPKVSKEIAEKGREYAGFSMIELARECLHVCGVNTKGMSRDMVAAVALNGRYGYAHLFGGAMTTSDLPNILANVANKTLRQAYEAAPQTFKKFCRATTASDFKPINRVALSDIASIHKVNEKGEFHRTYVSDSKETYSLATFGDIVPLTRKTVINDDLQALTRIPAALGIGAASLESDTVWAIITANGAMADGVPLFHATHKNLVGSNALAALSNLGAARKYMRKQTAPKGTKLNLDMRYLIVPTALELTADQFVYPTNIVAATALTSGVPDWVRRLEVICEPRLDDVASVGDTNWYGAADPSQIDTIEYCYLEGANGVMIEAKQGFEVDGVEIKVRLDFAAAAIDYRGLVKNTSGA